LYRDGKQHTGLNDSQARCKNKLNFHFNMSLTAINIAKVTHWHIKQQYNEQGYLNYITAEISSPLGRSGGAWEAHIQRNARGQATAYEFTGGVHSSFAYDNAGRPIAQTVKTGLGRESYKRSYHWNAANQLVQTIDHIKNKGISYTYDALNQLVSATIGSSETEMKNPDAIGNLYETPERKDKTYSSGGRLERDKNWYYYYDTKGNLQLKSPFPLHGKDPSKKWQMGCWHYEWYANGMLKSVQKPSGAVVSFEYDALGRRTAKIAGKKITRYLWDGNVMLQEWKYNIKLRPKLVVGDLGELYYDAVEPTDDVITWVYEEEDYVPVAKLINGERFSIISDYIGRPIQVYNDGGEIVWETEYDIYGRLKNLKGDRAFQPFRQLGQIEDVELEGLYYNRYRFYESSTGLYISQDPIGLLGKNPNLYAYVLDSNTWIDILGLAAWDDLGMDFKTWFDQASTKDISDNIKDVTSKRGLRYGGGKHELFPVSQAALAKDLGFTASELEKMSVDTKRITFVDVLDSDGNPVSGKHHSSSASWHFHDKLIKDLQNAKSKTQAKKIIAKHHKAHMRLDCK
ncbi:MAG TPA: RHS repeat-associated core domain-containing protein, partial [Flavobacterium sp.]|nr:RHS repeat-associated core domain-containing protein [Flavobacterium sp.]